MSKRFDVFAMYSMSNKTPVAKTPANSCEKTIAADIPCIMAKIPLAILPAITITRQNPLIFSHVFI